MTTSEENIARIQEIVEQIRTLTEEAVGLAEKEQVQLDFSTLPFTEAYGAGGLRFTPDVEGIKDSWGDEIDSDDLGVWRSSGSDFC